MAGTGNTASPQTVVGSIKQAAEQVTGTGTANDGSVVPLEAVEDPTTGLPAQLALDSSLQTLITLAQGSGLKVAFGALAATTDSVALGGAASAGVTSYFYRSTGTFTVQTIKGSAGTLYGFSIFNNQAATAYVSLYDISGTVTPGTSTPIAEYQVAANTEVMVTLPPQGVAFLNAIKVFSATAENGATGSASGIIIMADYV